MLLDSRPATKFLLVEQSVRCSKCVIIMQEY
jgi:hypothetical protein